MTRLPPPRQTTLALSLVALLVFSAFAGLLSTWEGAEAGHATGRAQIANPTISDPPDLEIGPGVPTTFSFEAHSATTGTSISCSYLYGGKVIPDDELSQTTCNDGSPTTVTWTPDASNADWSTFDGTVDRELIVRVTQESLSGAEDNQAKLGNVKLDVTPPIVSVQAAPNQVFVADTSFSSATPDFTVEDPGRNALDHNIEKVILSGWSGTPSEDDEPPYTLQFPAGSIAADEYNLVITAVDELGNRGSSTLAVRADKDRPRLESVIFTSTGAICGDFHAVSSGKKVDPATFYCDGPYTVKIVIRERFPALSGGTAAPPIITNSAFNFPPNPASITQSGTDLWTFTYTNVQRVGTSTPFTFDIQYQEGHSARPLAESGIADDQDGDGLDDRLGIGFGLTTQPLVNWQPAQKVFSGPATFSIRQGPNCGSLTGTLDPQTFCVPTSVDPIVKLVDEDGTTELTDFSKSASDSALWEATWDPADGALQKVRVRVQQGSAPAALSFPPAEVVVDTVGATFPTDPIQLYRFQAQETETVTHGDGWLPVTSTPTVPLSGETLVKISYTSFGAQQLKFRLIRDGTQSQTTPSYVEYTYFVQGADAGTLKAGGGHDASKNGTDTVVRLARNVQLVDTAGAKTGTTPPSGCQRDGLDRPAGERVLWGEAVACWFLIETATPPAATESIKTQGSGVTKLDSGQTYILQPLILEPDGTFPYLDPGDNQIDDAARNKMKPERATVNFGTVTFTPTVREVGAQHTLNVQISDSSPKKADTWVCLFRVVDKNNPLLSRDVPFEGYFTGAAGNPDCKAFYEASGAPARTLPRTTGSGGSDDGTRREFSFTPSELFTEDGTPLEDGGIAIDTFFFRLIARDDKGNFRVKNLISGQAPDVFKIARFKVGAREVAFATTPPCTETVTSGCTTIDQFINNVGCTQPPGGNALGNPCIRRVNHLKDPATGSYPAFVFPVELSNLGTQPDKAVLTWEHQGGELAWTVRFKDPATGAQDTNGRLEVDLAASSNLANPTLKKINVEIVPSDTAVGGEFKLAKITAKSGNSQSGTIPTANVFLQATLAKLERGSVTLAETAGGTHAGVLRTEMVPDEIATYELKLSNTGNIRDAFKVDLDNARSTNRGTNELCQWFDATLPSGTNFEDFLQLRLQTSTGSAITSRERQLTPGQVETLQLRVETGRNVPTSDTAPHRCTFRVTVGGDTIAVSPLEPRLELDVVGTPDIKLWQVLGEREEMRAVTNKELVFVVPPSQTDHIIELYMENTGDIPLDPKLTIRSLENKLGLSGEWRGVVLPDSSAPPTATERTVPESTLKLSFPLAVSDGDDPTRVKDIRDHFDAADGTTAGDGSVTTLTGNRWKCVSKDDPGNEPSDNDPRVLCRILLRFDAAGAKRIVGDLVKAELSWLDDQQGGTPAKVTIRLVSDHVGSITTSSVSDQVVGNNQDLTIETLAQLGKGLRFDPADADVPSTLEFAFAPTGMAPVTCALQTESVALGPSSKTDNRTEATFEMTMAFNGPAPGSGSDSLRNDATCQVNKVSGKWRVTTNASKAAGAGTLLLGFDVRDENNSRLRQIDPIHIRFVPGPSFVSRPSQAAQFKVFEDSEIQVNGTQFARLLFDPRNDRFGASPSETDTGVLLSRRGGALENFVDCTLNGNAWSTNAGGPGASTHLEWMRLASAKRSGQEGVERVDHRSSTSTAFMIPTGRDVHGELLRRQGSSSTNQSMNVVGGVHAYVWGEAGKPVWREGWNPVVFYVEDRDGDPADTNVRPTVEFNFLMRQKGAETGSTAPTPPAGADPVVDRFKVLRPTSQSNVVRNLGNGLYAVDIYLPEGLASTHETAKTGLFTVDAGDEPKKLADDVGQLSDLVEEFSLELKVSSGRSKDNQDIQGTAHWRLVDLGIVDPTTGKSLVRDGGVQSASKETNIQFGSDSETRQRTFLHQAVRFMGGPVAPGTPWETGPGIHNFEVAVHEERSSHSTSTTVGTERTAKFRDHTFAPVTDARASLVLTSLDRTLPGSNIPVSLQKVSFEGDGSTGAIPGLYGGLLNLRDVGLEEFLWFVQLTVTKNENIQTATQIRVKEDREPAMGAIPMPLCIRAPVGATNDRAGDFDGEFETPSLSSRRVVDLRTIPGLSLGSGQFSLTPFVGPSTGPGLRHDTQALLSVIGEGSAFARTESLNDLAELNVPIRFAIRTSGPAAGVVAKLVTADKTELSSTALTFNTTDQVWKGELIPAQLGEMFIELHTRDVLGNVKVSTKKIEVKENVPPQITVERPAEVDGKRAIRPNGTIRVLVTDSSIVADAITLSRGTADAGNTSTPTGEALSRNNVSLSGITTQATKGSHSVTVTVLNETSDPVTGPYWVNATGAGAEGFNGTLDDEGQDTGTLVFNGTGTATVIIEAGNASESFSVTVRDPAGSSSGFAPVTDGVEITCEASVCTVDYEPSGIEAGDRLVLRIKAFITDADQVTRDLTIDVDGTAPVATLEIGEPSVPGTPHIVGPATQVSISGTDDIAVDKVSVRAIQGGTEVAARELTSNSVDLTLQELGVTEEGGGTLVVTVLDLAGNEAETQTSIRVDATGPTVSAPTASLTEGGAVVTATITDQAGISTANLFAQRPGDASFTSFQMTEESGVWRATVPSPGAAGILRYYVQATDGLGNVGALGSAGNPRSLDLAGGPVGNQPPVVTISTPSNNQRVSGTIEVVYTATDPEGATVNIVNVRISPTSGPASQLTPGEGTVSFDTTTVSEGRAVITIEATDGEVTGTGTVAVIVDNQPDAGGCEGNTLNAGKNVPVCFRLDTPLDVSRVQVALVQNGEELETKTLDPSPAGEYQTAFDLPSEGTYALKITQVKNDGSTVEKTSEPFQVQSALDDIVRPLGRFITLLILGALVMGGAAFAAFGRWN